MQSIKQFYEYQTLVVTICKRRDEKYLCFSSPWSELALSQGSEEDIVYIGIRFLVF